MTATVTGTNLADLITFCERIPFQRATPGQLWERIAESH